MAKSPSRLGQITVGGTAIAGVTQYKRTEKATVEDISGFDQDRKDFGANQIEDSFQIDGMYDPAEAQQGDIRAGATVALVLYPIGNTSGNPEFDGSVVVETFEITGARDQYITFSATVMGTMAEGQVTP